MTQPDSTSSADDDTSEPLIGEYANLVSVGCTQTEFYLDFQLMVPGAATQSSQIYSVRRILISPMLVRSLIGGLEDEVNNYQSTYLMTLLS